MLTVSLAAVVVHRGRRYSATARRRGGDEGRHVVYVSDPTGKSHRVLVEKCVRFGAGVIRKAIESLDVLAAERPG